MSAKEISSEIIVNTVLHVAHQEYSKNRKRVTITKAVKLILKSIEELQYPNISYGCYKYGEYSFEIYNQLSPIFVTRSLHGAKINKNMINPDLIEIIRPVIKELQPKMTGTWNKFLKWAHEDRISSEYHGLYNAHDRLHTVYYNMDKIKKKAEFTTYGEQISDIITDMDNNLDHVDDKSIQLYFQYTNYLEGFLLITKNRDFKLQNAKEVYKGFKSIYRNDISSLLFPFEKTLKGDNQTYEKSVYEINFIRKYNKSKENLEYLNNKLIKYDFKPTIEELDDEISIELDGMDKSDKIELFEVLKS